ncbi:MAG: M55 family metallopeptidase [Burkholderiales bacterium]
MASAQLKVYISADMEGLAGAVTEQQLGPEGFEYARFREFMTEEVLAAIRGAQAAGATEILVSDSHGNGQNLLIEKLPKEVQIVRSWPRPLGMMEGIDESFDAAVFIGYHSATSNPAGVRAHTFSSSTLTDVRLNGRSVGEAAWNATIAGHFGVPIVAVSGDDVAVAEAQAQIGEIEGAVVKWAIGFHAARTLTPAAAYEVIEAAVRRGVERRREIKALDGKGAATLEVSFKHYRQAELLTYLPRIERLDAHSIRFKARDIIEASRFMQFVNKYDHDLAP